MIRVRVPQSAETDSGWLALQGFRFRCAFARSPDARRAGDSGQDYLELAYDDRRLAFALCDGVSQSFFGDLAARVLGHALVEWLADLPVQTVDLLQCARHDPGRLNSAEAASGRPGQRCRRLQADLAEYLLELVTTAGLEVDQVRLPQNTPPLVSSVLEQKRLIGSESMFTAGLLDLVRGSLTMAWLGDSRLRVCDERGAQSVVAGPQRERWSSVRGPLGKPHVRVVSLDGVTAVVAYSDGCAALDADSSWMSNDSPLGVVATTASDTSGDDASILDIRLG